jgi:hypothetical protein
MKSGDFKWQQGMMDAIISAIESSMIGFKYVSIDPRVDDADDQPVGLQPKESG